MMGPQQDVSDLLEGLVKKYKFLDPSAPSLSSGSDFVSLGSYLEIFIFKQAFN